MTFWKRRQQPIDQRARLTKEQFLELVTNGMQDLLGVKKEHARAFFLEVMDRYAVFDFSDKQVERWEIKWAVKEAIKHLQYDRCVHETKESKLDHMMGFQKLKRVLEKI